MINIDKLSKQWDLLIKEVRAPWHTDLNKIEALVEANRLNQAEWSGRFTGFMVGLVTGGVVVWAVCNWVYYFGGYAK